MINSLGICELGLWYLDAQKIIHSFVEFYNYLGAYKFRNCRHNADLGCVIHMAMKKGNIVKEYLNNYHRIYRELTIGQ